MSAAPRPLGRSGLAVPPLILGGNVFGWTVDRDRSFALLDRFVDEAGKAGGVPMIDTADAYSAWIPGHKGGESETIIGEWLRASGKRDRVLIATKVGMMPGTGGEGLAPARIAAAAEESLRRLGTDRIDLYYAHKDDAKTPLADSLAAFAALVSAGKVVALGASNYAADRLAEALALSAAHGLPRYEVLQPLYNLVDRDVYEGPLQALCLREEIGVAPYYGLAAGFLTGKYRTTDDVRGDRSDAVGKRMTPRGLAVLAALDTVAAEAGATQAQVAIAWLAGRPGIAAPIASATSDAQLDALLGAMRLSLDEAQVAALDAAGAA